MTPNTRNNRSSCYEDAFNINVDIESNHGTLHDLRNARGRDIKVLSIYPQKLKASYGHSPRTPKMVSKKRALLQPNLQVIVEKTVHSQSPRNLSNNSPPAQIDEEDDN